MSALSLVLVVGVVVYVVVSQLLGQPIRRKRLLVLPAVLTLVGVLDLGKGPEHLAAKDVVLVAVGALLAAGFGYAQGRSMHLEDRDGALWGKLPARGLVWWVALFVSRGVLIAVAVAMHAKAASGVHAEILILGVNRIGQAVDVVLRARAAGIPFAPEPEGSGAGAGSLLNTILGDSRARQPVRRDDPEHGTTDVSRRHEREQRRARRRR